MTIVPFMTTVPGPGTETSTTTRSTPGWARPTFSAATGHPGGRARSGGARVRSARSRRRGNRGPSGRTRNAEEVRDVRRARGDELASFGDPVGDLREVVLVARAVALFQRLPRREQGRRAGGEPIEAGRVDRGAGFGDRDPVGRSAGAVGEAAREEQAVRLLEVQVIVRLEGCRRSPGDVLKRPVASLKR